MIWLGPPVAKSRIPTLRVSNSVLFHTVRKPGKCLSSAIQWRRGESRPAALPRKRPSRRCWSSEVCGGAEL